MGEHTYVVDRECPMCGKMTRIIKTKSRILAQKVDEDFCVHYRDFNPYYYKIWFCEHCGYAAEEKRFTSPMSSHKKQKVRDFLEEKKISIEFFEERSLPDAVAFYKLAIYFEEMMGAPLNSRAGLYLAMAWLYRDSGEAEKEAAAMRKAAELYDQSLATETYPFGKMTDNLALYLVGAIYFRLGDFEQTAQHLSRIISDQRVRTMEFPTFKRARDLWHEVKERRAQAKKEENVAEKS